MFSTIKRKMIPLFLCFCFLNCWPLFSFCVSASENELDENNTDVQGLIYLLDEVAKTASVCGIDENIMEPHKNIPTTIRKNQVEYTVTSIEDGVFGSWVSTVVNIPKTVTDIGSDQFFGSNLWNIFVNSNNEYYSSDEDGVLYDKDKTTLIKFPADHDAISYHIPESVTTIGDNAFYDCIKLRTVVIPYSVTEIGKCAFLGCARITKLNIPEGVSEIKEGTFSGSLLREFTIGQNVTSIGNFAFESCRYLTTVIIPDNVISIGDYAFESCMKLKELTIPKSVITIGRNAFYLETVIYSKNNPAVVSYCVEYGNKSIDYVDDLIGKIDMLNINTLNLSNESEILKLKESYDSLSEIDKNDVTNAAILIEAADTINHLSLFSEYNGVFLNDSVKLFASIGVLPNNVAVDTNTFESTEEQIDTLQKQFGDETVFITGISFSFKDENSFHVNPDTDYGAAITSVKVDEAYTSNSTLTAIYISNDGSFTELTTQIKNGYATFPVNQAGNYALIEKGGDIGNTKTIIIIVGAGMVILTIFIFIFISIRRMRK